MKYYGMIETRQNGRIVKERSQDFDNPLASEAWLHSACREARDMKIRITDHYLMKGE